jgi:hypothetical protein
MRVRIFTVDQSTGEERPVAVADSLSECMPNEDNEYHETLAELEQFGRAWIGGGAAQLFKLETLPRCAYCHAEIDSLLPMKFCSHLCANEAANA